MTKDKARKNATRQRKAETGERYVVARRRSTDEYSWLRCANCDTTLDVRIEGLFCSELCRQTADLVRYARRKVQQGQVDDPDIAWALQIRMALLLGGGYPGPERRLSRATRDAVIERDQVCTSCGAPGVEIDHIEGSSDDLSNLQLLCTECHRAKTRAMLVTAPPEKQEEARALWALRVLPPTATRLCDDTERWPSEWRLLKARRREHLLEALAERGYERSDFPGLTWTEIWDDIDDADTPEYGVWDDEEGPPPWATEDEVEHHYYLQEVMARDD